MTPRVAVMVSGNGSLLRTHIEAELPLNLVISDRNCIAIHDIAVGEKLHSMIFNRNFVRKRLQRKHFTIMVRNFLVRDRIDIIIMAGFRTKLSPEFFHPYYRKSFRGKVLNIHPSLLPDFKGAHAIQDAHKAGVTYTGCTFHIANAKLDSGRVVAQQKVRIYKEDPVESLRTRVTQAEQELYPEVVKRFIEMYSI